MIYLPVKANGSHGRVTALTAAWALGCDPRIGPPKAVPMAVSRWQLNRFEQILFGAALALAAVILVVRIGAVAIMWYMNHVR